MARAGADLVRAGLFLWVQELLQREELEALDTALGALDPQDLRLVELRYLEAREWKDVAEAMGIPVGTAKDRDARIRKLLQKRLPR